MTARRTSPLGGFAKRLRGGRVPFVLAIPAVLALGFLLAPLLGLVIEAPWSSLGTQLGDSRVLTALRLSLVTATISTVICLACGVPLAWLLARTELPGRKLIRTLVTVPLTLPPVVGGVALLLVFGRNGLLGQYLWEWFGIALPFSTAGVVMAQTFVAMPFLVVTVDGALRGADRRYEEAAATLGAGRWLAFRRVTLPMVAPGIGAGAVLCWARALGEFGATITFAGNFPGQTRTLPLATYLALETDPEVAIVLSLVLLVVSVLVLAGLREKWLGAAT